MALKDWDVVKDLEEYEALRKLVAEKKERGEKITPHERSLLGGLSLRSKVETFGYQYYRNLRANRGSKV